MARASSSNLADLDVMVHRVRRGRDDVGRVASAPDMARRMATSIRQLHAGPRFRLDFDMFRITDATCASARSAKIRIPDGFRERMSTTSRGRARDAPPQPLPTRSVPQRPAGGELHRRRPEALAPRLRVLGNNDPTFELANTAQECEFDDGAEGRPLRGVLRRGTAALLARMRLQALMSDMGWTLWAAIQAEISTIDYDFWGWAEERWGRAREVFTGEEFGRLLAETAR